MAANPEILLDETRALSVTTQGEISATTLAAEVEAVVKAKFAMAAHRPRDLDQVRSRLLKDCQRPGFARTARYKLPRANTTITGPTIRFAEAAVRAMGNVDISVRTIFEDADRRKVRIDVIDLEANAGYSSEVILEKVVERRELKQGQRPIGQRLNSSGKTVYLVEATEDEMLQKSGAAVSKAIRTNGLRLVPGDIVAEALEVCVETERNADAADPDAARKRMLDAFDGIGISPSALKEYVGQELATLAPAQVQELRGLFAAISEGTTTWAHTLGERSAAREQKTSGAAAKAKDAVAAKAATARQAAQEQSTEQIQMSVEEKAKIEARERAEAAK